MAVLRRITIRAVAAWLLMVLAAASTVAQQPAPQPPAAAGQAGPPAAVAAPPQAPEPPPPPPPEVALPAETKETVARLGDAIDNIEKAVERVRQRDEGLAAQRIEVDTLLTESQKLIESLRPRLDEVRSQYDKLGKAPEKGAPAEAASIVTERARLSALAAQLDGAIKAAELFEVRGRQQIARIQEYRRDVFTRDLFRRTRSPLRLTTWYQVTDEVPRIGYQLSTLWGYWWRDAQAQLPLLALLAAAVIAIYAGLDLAARRVFAGRLAPVSDPLPSFFARAACATWVAALRAAPAIAATLALYLGLMFLGLLDYQIQPYAEAITVAVVIAAAVSGLAVAILTPRYPHWRLVNLSDRSAAQLVRLTRGIAIAFAFDLVLREMIRLMFLPLPVSVAQTLINSIVFAALLIGIVRTRFEPAGLVTAEPVSRYRPRWLKLPLLIISIAILTSSALGYVALGSYVTSQVLLTGSCLVAVTLLHIAIKALAAEPEDNTRPMGRMLETQLGLDRDRRRQVSRGLDWSLNLGLVALAIPAILLSLGFSGTDILNHAKALVFGFEIGHFRISLARILVAIGLFASIVFATRLLQRWLQSSVLTPDRMDPGIAHSVHTGIGYAGIALAGLFAVSYAGFDITNLAIVAGALSVGIGFGLQSIVNNFVSGLILLVERPVKVGDWIVVKGQEGYVRRISVRATEIETFDRASLIMPNSELITGSVTNWTHRNAMGRITINVGASYRSDPEQVIKILTDIAANCPLILQHPKPLVIFEDLGASALEFSLRAVVPDINSGLEARNSLRIAILKAFREAGIEIPYPQQDVHLHGADSATAALATAFQARKHEKDAAE